jgi:xanthine dehydrogenase YagS FAD-binding subunit
MKTFTNIVPKDMDAAAQIIRENQAKGLKTSVAGGGSDLLGMIKERLVTPDVLIKLGRPQQAEGIKTQNGRINISALTTLDAVSRHDLIRKEYAVLAEAAESVGTPQIRNAGTLAGNVCQRPWCWYYSNGFPCLKNGGDKCFSASGEKPTARDFRRRAELHRASFRYRARAGGSGRRVSCDRATP